MSDEKKDAAPRPEALPAGWEMDVLISARIFGAPYAGACRTDGPVVLLPSGGLPTCPHYSTDIAAAWQVVERMVADGRWPEIEYWPSTKGTPWRCDVTGPDPKVDLRVWADTAPLAICRAALAARPAETPEGR